MITYHLVTKVLDKIKGEDIPIKNDIIDILSWVQDKIQIDEETRSYRELRRKDLHDNLTNLIKQETYSDQTIRTIFEDYVDYIDLINESTCYHCHQDIGKIETDDLYIKISDLLYKHFYCYDHDYSDLPNASKMHIILKEMYSHIVEI